MWPASNILVSCIECCLGNAFHRRYVLFYITGQGNSIALSFLQCLFGLNLSYTLRVKGYYWWIQSYLQPTEVFNNRAFLGINYRTSYFLVLTNNCATTKLQLSFITRLFLALIKYTRAWCLTAGCAVIADSCAVSRWLYWGIYTHISLLFLADLSPRGWESF